MKKKKDEITIRSSAAEYLTYVASVGDQQGMIELHLGGCKQNNQALEVPNELYTE